MQSKLNEIEVDPNFQLSEDAKWGHELAKNPAKWYQYFNTQLPANTIKTSIFEDDDEFDKLFQ